MISALRPHNCNSTATRSAKTSRLRHAQLHRTVSHAANQPCAISNRSSPRHIPVPTPLIPPAPRLHPPLPPPHTPSEYATRQISHLQGAYGVRLILVAGRQLNLCTCRPEHAIQGGARMPRRWAVRPSACGLRSCPPRVAQASECPASRGSPSSSSSYSSSRWTPR